ncbi:hypothetical protein PGTUg99_003890 [Puccinia graminis f. sp. tritici]|uniref:Nuclear segregation protein Bfr1 n=1 Tax=Puccinia graminis f. sp. tritici TaxID=56615 RepID=A0A5B0R736_PUCGR|nr:hypothetical protein PGTUg99_003890 [Puccinia graminis f. sp. tritici]
MPPKSTTVSAKAASIPNRPKNIDKHLNGTPAGSSGGRPSKDAYSQEQDQYKREIDRLQSEISELRLKIGDPKTGGSHGPLVARRKALRDEMDALRQEQSKGKSSRGKLLDQIKAANDSVQRKIKELNANRAKLPYKSSVEVDAKIRQLESQIESGTMRIVEEKKALTEIQNLRKARKLVDAFGPQQELIEAEKEQIEELRKQLDDPHNRSTNDRWSEIKRELDQINEQLDESSKSRDKLFEERNKLQDALTEVFNKKRESSTRHKEANEKYYAKMQEDQQRRIDRQKAERDAQEKAEIEQVHIEMREQAALPAYGREIEDCRTLILHFDKLMGNAPSIEENPSEDPKSTASTTLPKIKEIRQVDGKDGFEGMVAIKKKGAEEEEFFMGGGGGGGKKNKKSKKPATEAPANNQALNLPLSTINALYALAVPVPMTREDVVKTIATLSEKKNWFTENQARVTKERIAETEAKIAAAQARLKTNTATPVEPSAETESAPTEKEAESPDPAQQ